MGKLRPFYNKKGAIMLLEEETIQQKLEKIKPFLSKQQWSAISNDVDGLEYEFKDVVDRLFKTITTMAKTYEQDEKGDDAICYLHYFHGNSDWYIVEKDSYIDKDNGETISEQLQAFGYAVLNGDTQNAELGYISIKELTKLNVELDFYFDTTTLGKIKINLVENSEVPEVDTIEYLNPNELSLTQFVNDFGDSLLSRVAEQAPPLFDGSYPDKWDKTMNSLKRQPFDAQREIVASIASLFFTHGQPAGVINAEMGTGKTMMAISLAAVTASENMNKNLIVSPPHLVYKWRREILNTIPDAKVVTLNGPDSLAKLIKLRLEIEAGDYKKSSTTPCFYIIGRVRMRMGFNWSVATRKTLVPRFTEKDEEALPKLKGFVRAATCSVCDKPQYDKEGEIIIATSNDKRADCKHCGSPLWTLQRANKKAMTQREILNKALCQIPTIGKKTADKLLNQFGETLIKGMLADNIYQFVNLMDENGDLVFSDRQSVRMERALAKTEFGFGQGGYQPTEFIKRYLPSKFFDMLIVDEGHEYKNGDSAQGQAMGVLASKVNKTLLLTGTLMGGYASDLFYLLWRINPSKMIECGFSAESSMGAASMAFMREHGVLKDVFKESEGNSHKTARGKKITVHTSKAPGFGPKGIVDHVLPITAFLKLKDIGQNVLPAYTEEIINVPMTQKQGQVYKEMSENLGNEMRKCLSKGDNSLLGVVMNVLLRWPDTGFNAEMVVHPRTRDTLCFEQPIFDDLTLAPKEQKVIEYVKKEKAEGRRVLVYTTYTGKRDTAARLKRLFENENLKTAVLRSTVGTDKREDWIIDQVDRDIDVMVCNPELVKTGLDLLDFPTIIFMQTGYNVYTVQQASRRSWRIGQTLDVKVVFFGYEETAQATCMRLMGKKIAVSQSTSGDIPDNGLDSLNTEEQSIEMELARALMKR